MFRIFDYLVFYVKSMVGFLFRNNIIVCMEIFFVVFGNLYVFYLNGCKKVVIEGIVFEGEIFW